MDPVASTKVQTRIKTNGKVPVVSSPYTVWSSELAQPSGRVCGQKLFAPEENTLSTGQPSKIGARES